MSDLISKQRAIEAIDRFIPADPMMSDYTQGISVGLAIATRCIEEFSQENHDSSQGLVKQQTKRQATIPSDCISRQDAIKAIMEEGRNVDSRYLLAERIIHESDAVEVLSILPSAQPEQRYTEEELRVFKHGISLSLLSKRSSQHWRYDEDTATEIEFLERLYEKVVADMRGEEDED